MKKYLNISFFLFSIVFLINTSFAQNNISKIEYFIDNDPGFGSGTSVAFTNDTVLDLNFSASLNGLANGFHFLFIRALNDSGWGQTYVHPFSYSENSAFTSLANINKIEYYFDVDPGYDSAISINFTPDSIINILHNANLTGLTPGLHFLHMRAKDANGQWSLNYNKPFIAIGSAGLPNITELEYSIDTIAGYGLGTSVPITPDSALSEAFYIDLSGISDGFHFLHIRAKDDNGNWSLNYFRPFLCSGSEDFALIDKFEYFFDTDPGYDSGIVVNLTNDTIIDEYFNADLSGLSLGMHMMHIRAKDENGYWSIDYIKPIVVSNSLGFPDINAVEYFIDTDPGYGNGTSVNLAPDSIINQAFTINLNGINPGIHTLFFRALDDNGIWSQTYTRAFLMNESNSASNITALEYFVDVDPGFGNGISIPISPDSILIDSFISNIDTFAVGNHKIFVRAKDEFGNWTLTNYRDFCVGPQALFSASDVCLGDTTTFINLTDTMFGPLTYKWDIDNNGSIDYTDTTDIKHYFSTSGIYHPKLIVYQNTNCPDTFTMAINVYDNPILSLSSLGENCINDTIYLLSGGSPTGGVYIGNGVNNNYFNPSAAGQGSHTISYIFMDNHSCSDTISGSIVVNALPTVNLNSFSDVCINASPFTLSGGNPMGGYYSGTGVSNNIFSPSFAGTGSHQIVYSYSDFNGCLNTDTQSLQVNSLPNVTLSSFLDVCVTASPFTLSGGNPVGGTYSGIGVNSAGVFHPSITGIGTHSISYSYKDANNCLSTASSNINVIPIPTSTFTLVSSSCLHDTVTITYTGTASGTASYNWSFDGGIIASGTGQGPIQVYWTSPGYKTVSLSVTENNCNSSLSSNSITINSITAYATSIGSPNICPGDSCILLANTGSGLSYHWLKNNTIIPSANNSYFYANSAGFYNVVVTNLYGCYDTSNTINVAYHTIPSSTFSYPSIVCLGDTAIITYSGNADSTASFNWNFGNGQIISGSGIGPYKIIWNNIGNKNITLQVDNGFCISPITLNTLNIITTQAFITVLGSTSFCLGDSVSLNANTGINLTYKWLRNGTIINGATKYFYNAKITGNYTVKVTDTITNCSKVSTAVNINVYAANFNIAFTANPTSFTAPPFNVSFTNLTPNPGNYYYTWNFGDGTSSSFFQPTHTYLYDSLYTVSLIVQSISTGCYDTLEKADYILCTGGNPNPCTVIANITPSGPKTICMNDSIKITATPNPNYTYKWILNGVIISGATDSVLYAKQNGVYRVIVSDTICSVTSSPFQLNHYPGIIPIIESLDSIRPCTNDSMELFISNFYNNYHWSTGENTQSIYVKYSGSYSVTTSDIYGCNLVSQPFVVNSSLLPPPNICIIGVDSVNNIRIVWEKYATVLIDSFNIYRESTSAGIYNKIGSIPYNATCIFTDTNANPAQMAYRYKLSAIDTCGSESPLGDFHKTIHLTVNTGLNGTWNLLWDKYEGFYFYSYKIYRGADSLNMTLLSQITSTATSYTDLNPPTGAVYYQIEVTNPNGCYPDSIYSKANTNYNSSRSNVANTIALLGIDKFENHNLWINIYPNPSHGKFTLATNTEIRNKINIQVFNPLGELIYYEDNIEIFGRQNRQIDLKKLPKGIYFIQLKNKEINLTIKIVLQ